MSATPYYEDDVVTVYAGDCLDVLRELPDASVHAVVTDPPYGLGFMGREWDALPPGLPFAAECLRVLKPGGHLLAFGGTRTHHRLACAIEDAGFEIRDSIAWLYGSGFPKSLDVSKAIDRRPDAEHWQGWGTALKPAHEPIVTARKPLAGTVAANVLEHGTGAINVDGCRVGTSGATRAVDFVKKEDGRLERWDEGYRGGRNKIEEVAAGRWPPNVVLDETQAAELDAQSGVSVSRAASMPIPKGHAFAGTTYGGDGSANGASVRGHDDAGGASRFFPTFRYEPKAPSTERPRDELTAHPTVKPLDLMRWLVRLVTPPGGTVLDPFAGSGTTAEACVIENFKCITIEREDTYLPLVVARLTKPIQVGLDFGEGA